jgi:insulysin
MHKNRAHTKMRHTDTRATHTHTRAPCHRFAQFFVAPQFTPGATARELNAIESEHAKNLQSDGFRVYQLQKLRAAADHPYSKFGTGNK